MKVCSSETYIDLVHLINQKFFINFCLDFLLSVVWTYDILVNILRIKYLNSKYMNENCRLYMDYHISFEYFPKSTFIWEIYPK